MPQIKLETLIQSDIETCFDLSRSIDLHKISTVETNEKAIGGKTSGLINLGEFVTWQATHFGITQTLTSRISEFNRPYHFRDEQLRGPFAFFTHDHYFEVREDKVLMKDVFNYTSPFGYLGNLFNYLVLTNHLRSLLLKRNAVIKDYAESNKWGGLLNKEVANYRE